MTIDINVEITLEEQMIFTLVYKFFFTSVRTGSRAEASNF